MLPAMVSPSPAPRALEYVPVDRVADDATFRLRHPGDVSALAQSIAQLGQLFPVELRRVGEELQPITGFRRLAALRLLRRDRVLARVHERIDDAAAAMIAAGDALDSLPLEREDITELRERYRGMGWITPALEELLSRALQKADERLEDLAARLQGRAPPDRAVIDEDAVEDEVPGVLDGEEEPSRASPPAEPPGAAPLGRPRRSPATSDAAAAAELAAHAAEVGPEAPPREVTADELAEDVAYRLSEITQDLAALADSWNDVPELLRGIVADQLRYYSELGEWLDQHAEGA
jgi:hypothetical protein